MPVFQGRIEAKHVVPTGGASVSVSTGAMTSAVTATLPAGNYFLSAAGGVSSSTTALTTALNATCSPYPQSAAALQSALGYGTWTSGAGWLCQETSGSLAAVFGAPSLTAVSTPTYSNTGPGTGGDLAVGFNSAADAFSGGNVFNVTAADDLILAWVGKVSSTSANADVAGKYASSPGYTITAEQTRYRLFISDGVNSGVADTASTTGLFSGEWHVAIAVIERASGKMRIGSRSLSGTSSVGTETTITTVGNLTNAAANFGLGNVIGLNGAGVNSPLIAAFYTVVGSGVATGLSTNLSTALTNLANAVNSSFAVSPSLIGTSATGRVAISNSFWPCALSWTSADLRDLYGFDRNVDYPATAAQMATAVGYGTYTAGYLCNETSGNLTSAFGTPAILTAASTPTYSNLGARGGSDKAVGLDSAADSFSGGLTLDIGASDDLIICWVGKFTSVPVNNSTMFSKVAGAFASGWAITCQTGTTIGIFGTSTQATVATNFMVGHWHVGMVVIERSTGKLRIGIQSLTDSTTAISTEATTQASYSSSAANFIMGASAWTSQSTYFQCSAFYVGVGSGYATGASANLSTALTNFATYMKSQTSTKQAKGLLFPDSPLNCDDHPSMAPEDTDLRGTESPDGLILGLSGNKKYVHTNVRWSRVPVDRIREASATYANASLEVFFRDCITGLGGHSWFTPLSKLQVYWSNAGTDTLLGTDYSSNSTAGVSGWSLTSVSKFRDLAKPSQEGYVGQFDVVFPRLVSNG